VIVNDPLRLSGGVNEQDVREIKVGDAGTRRARGRRQARRLRAFSSRRWPTRRRGTFTVEVAVANPQGKIPAGLSARVLIPVDSGFRAPDSGVSALACR